MKTLTQAFVLVALAIIALNFGLSKVYNSFRSLVQERGGMDDIHPDLVLFYHDISEEDLRLEDPEGFLELAAIEHTPEHTERALEWSFNMRQRIFTRRYGRPYVGRPGE